MISLLNISDTVEICITDKLLNKHFYKTKIVDLFDDENDDYLATMVPTSDSGVPIIFFKDTPYKLYAKFDAGIIVWQIDYLSTRRNGGLLQCVFRVSSLPEITQRREYFRQPVAVPLKFYKFQGESPSSEFDDTAEFDGNIIDISGGGCAFYANEFLNVGSVIETSFTFKETPFTFFAHVLDRVNFLKTHSKYEFSYRVSWVNPSTRDIDILVRLVFEQQRDNIAKNKSRIETLGSRRDKLWE